MSPASAHAAEESERAAERDPVRSKHDNTLGAEGPARLFRIGVISDTHGRLSADASGALAGVDAIVHAGDVGGPDILYELTAIAPVTAVLGNTDHDLPGFDLGGIASVRLGGIRVFVVHELKTAVVPEDAALVIYGHTHLPNVHRRGERLYVNPGSGSRSRGAGHTVAIVEVAADGKVDAEIVSV